MRTYTVSDICELHPCRDPRTSLQENWSGTILDCLSISSVPAADRLWVACHWVNEKTARRFAAWCAQRALDSTISRDPQAVRLVAVLSNIAAGRSPDDDLIQANEGAKKLHHESPWSVVYETIFYATKPNPRVAAFGAAQACSFAVGGWDERFIDKLSELIHAE